MVLGKHNEQNTATEEEFFKLEQALNQTAEDTYSCLKLLKKELSEYDSRNGNHFRNTATRFMRSDMRTAKDTAMDLKHVAHDINKSKKSSEAEISSARNMMDATVKAMEALKVTARDYDRENKQRMGVKGTVDAAVGGRHDKKTGHGTEGDEDRGFFGKSEKDRDEDRGFFGKKEKESEGGIFGQSDKPKQSEGGFFNKDEDEQRGGMLGGGKNEGHHKGVLGGTKDDNGGVMGSSETVETIVRKILRDHFNLRPLDHQIKAAEKSLTPSLMERAKEKMHDVKEKITGDKSEPTHDSHGHHYEGHHHVGHQEQAAVP
ncbi:hypothetical protein F442_17100 [Phytophthora nicotianae P10297]|uniref:Uncharacterized protein n=1 Tax=Phytophthora nicotianae P10297 TaxID=1317064 RepID=W2YIH6_PHYNI|nr:hypothetical protein F442_17100 [Phytophthora nicotianae P10297]